MHGWPGCCAGPQRGPPLLHSMWTTTSCGAATAGKWRTKRPSLVATNDVSANPDSTWNALSNSDVPSVRRRSSSKRSGEPSFVTTSSSTAAPADSSNAANVSADTLTVFVTSK